MNTIQSLKLFVVSIGLLWVVPAFSPAPIAVPQEITATERVPNYNWTNRFPRWLTPTVVDASYQATYASRIRANGVALTSVSVDTRNLAHVVGIVDTNPMNPVLVGDPPEWDFNYEPVIAYYNNRYDLRRNNGFCNRETIYTVPNPNERSLTGPPDIWVDSSDTIHVVWSLDNSGLVTDLNWGDTRLISDIYYAVKPASGTWAVTNLTSCQIASDVEERFSLPQIQVGSNGTVQIVCRRWRAAYERTLTWSETLQENVANWVTINNPELTYLRVCWMSGASTRENIPNSNPAQFATTPIRFALDSSNQPTVVWIQTDSPRQVYYSQRIDGQWTGVAPFGGTGSNDWPDVAIDPAGGVHFVWERVSEDLSTPLGIQYRGPGNVTAQLANSIGVNGGATYTPVRMFGQPHIICDSRGQPHVLYSGDRSFSSGPVNDGAFYAARIRNPELSSLNAQFSGQMPIASPNQEIPPPTMYEGTLLSHVTHIAISRNDQIHAVGQGMPPDGMDMTATANSDNYFGVYTRTMEYNLGVSDSAAMTGALPGAAVNVTNGNLHANVPLFSTKGVGPCQAPALVHNSLEFYSGLLAQGWKLNYEVYLIDHWLTISEPGVLPGMPPAADLLRGPDCLTLFLPDGRAVFFRYNAGMECHVADDSYGFFAKIERQSFITISPEYVLTTKHGVLWRFDMAGRLYMIEEPSGNRLRLDYGQSGLITQIVDMTDGPAPGRITQLQYTNPTSANHSPRIQTIIDPTSKQYSISYSGSVLTGVSLPASANYGFVVGTTTNTSTGERINLIRTFTRPGGAQWTCRYLADNRINEVEDPSSPMLLDSQGDTASPGSQTPSVFFDYEEPAVPNPEPPTAGPRETWVTDRRGNETLYRVDARRSLALEIHDPTVSGGSPPSGVSPVIRSFDAYGNLTQVTDRWGTATVYTYFPMHAVHLHVRDNLQTVARAGVTLRAFTYTNDEFNKVYQETTYATPADGTGAAVRVTTFSYDIDTGEVDLISFPTVTLPDTSNQSALVRYEYEGTRRALSRIIHPGGLTTNFGSYHSTHGLPQSVSRDGGTQAEEFLYDAMGNVTQHRQPQGGTGNDAPGWTTYTLDNLYRVDLMTDPAGRQTDYGYDAASNLTSVTPPAGGPVTTNFDPRGFRTGGSGPDGSWTQAVDANGNLRRTTDVRGAVTHMDYDSLNRLTESRSPGGSTIGSQNGGGVSVETTTYVHDLFQSSLHRMTITRSAAGASSRTTTQYFDSVGRVTAVVEPDGLTRQENVYDEQDNLVASQTKYDNVVKACTVQFRDARDRVYRVRRQNGGYGMTSTWTENSYTFYDAEGAVTMTVGPRGNPTQAGNLTDKVNNVYDVRGRPYQLRQPVDGQWVVVQENIYGDDDTLAETRVPDPTGATTNLVTSMTYTYTALKQLKTTRNANDKGLTYTYGQQNGQIDTVTNALNVVAKNTYHSSTQRLNESFRAWNHADERKTVHTWQNGLLSVKTTWNPQSQAHNAAWNYFYDYAGRMERMEAPQGAAEVYRYNGFSQHDRTVMGQKTVTSGFNSLGQENSRTVTGAFSGTLTFGYDEVGNRSLITDGTLRKETTWNLARGTPTYDSLFVDGTIWKTLEHGYDAAGNYNRLTFPDPTPTDHVWIRDDANRITAIEVGGQVVCSMEYTRGGLLSMTVLKNETGGDIARTTHSYDNLGRHIRAHTVRLPFKSTLSDIRWEYDVLDRIVKISYLHLGADILIGYNVHDEVVSSEVANNEEGTALSPFDNVYGGSPTGNESSPTEDVPANPATQLTVPDYVASYTYDKGGNRIGQSVDGVTTNFTYSAGNRLLTEVRTGRSVDHEYDEWGNETERTTTEGSTVTVETFGYNAWNLMSSYVREVGSSVQAEWQYDYWPTGERYGKTNLATNAGEIYICNGDNVVADYTVGSGEISLQNTYSQGLGLDQKSLRIPASGERVHYLGDQVGTLAMTLTDSGARRETSLKDVWGNAIAGDTNDERYGFAQREHDMESGLVYMRHRMYDPRIGRFTQIDPPLHRRDKCHYRYASNQPTLSADPLGLWDVVQEKNGKPLAQGIAIAEEGDTISHLASILRLDVTDYQRWLFKHEPGKGVGADLALRIPPDKHYGPNDKVPPGTTFRFPNSYLILRGKAELEEGGARKFIAREPSPNDVAKGAALWQKWTAERRIAASVVLRSFQQVTDDNAPTKNEAMARIREMSSLGTLRGIVYIGHSGTDYMMLRGSKRDSVEDLDVNEIKPLLGYKLSDFYNNSCFTRGDRAWYHLVSMTGRAYGLAGKGTVFEADNMQEVQRPASMR